MHFDSWGGKKSISFYFYRYFKNMTFLKAVPIICKIICKAVQEGPGAAPALVEAARLPASSTNQGPR